MYPGKRKFMTARCIYGAVWRGGFFRRSFFRLGPEWCLPLGTKL